MMLTRLPARSRASGNLQYLSHDVTRTLLNGSSNSRPARRKFHGSTRRRQDERDASTSNSNVMKPNARSRARDANSQIQKLNIQRVKVGSKPPSSTMNVPSAKTRKLASTAIDFDAKEATRTNTFEAPHTTRGRRRLDKLEDEIEIQRTAAENEADGSGFNLNELEDMGDVLESLNDQAQSGGDRGSARGGQLSSRQKRSTDRHARSRGNEEPDSEERSDEDENLNLAEAAAQGMSDGMLIWLLKRQARDDPDYSYNPKMFSRDELLRTGSSTIAGPSGPTDVVHAQIRHSSGRKVMEPVTERVLALRLLKGELTAFKDAEEKKGALAWAQHTVDEFARKRAEREGTEFKSEKIEFETLASGDAKTAAEGLVGKLVGGKYDASLLSGQDHKNPRVKEAVRLLANNSSYDQRNIDILAGKMEKMLDRGRPARQR